MTIIENTKIFYVSSDEFSVIKVSSYIYIYIYVYTPVDGVKLMWFYISLQLQGWGEYQIYESEYKYEYL